MQLETAILGLKRQQAALRAIGAAMVHRCDPAFLPAYSAAQQELAAAQNSMHSCLQASESRSGVGEEAGPAGAQHVQQMHGNDQDTRSDALLAAADKALV